MQRRQAAGQADERGPVRAPMLVVGPMPEGALAGGGADEGRVFGVGGDRYGDGDAQGRLEG